jgi:hypothetical protein
VEWGEAPFEAVARSASIVLVLRNG